MKKNPSINVCQPEVNGKKGCYFLKATTGIINLLGARCACRCNNRRNVVDNPLDWQE
jgi:hypothetical protein